MRSRVLANGPLPNPGKRVVVVDDNEFLLHFWRRMLSREDCLPYVTSSPEAALTYLKEKEADVLIADIVMPSMDGFELIRKARQLLPSLRVILTTGYTCDFSRIHLDVDASDVHVLMKPYNSVNEVQKFISRVLQDDETLDTDEDSFKNPEDIRIHVWNL